MVPLDPQAPGGVEPAPPALPPRAEPGARPRRRDAVDGEVRALLESGRPALAATAAIKGYGPAVHRYLFVLLRDGEDAADAHSEWSERLWRALPAFRWGCSLRTWASKIAWNVAQNVRGGVWRRRRRRLPTTAAFALAQEIRSTTARTAERRWQVLEKLRSRLSMGDQALLNLRLEQALSWNEIGEILTAEPDALMQRYKRLKDKLGRMVKDEGLDE
jgi:RNA polymerase sigma-70 factor (ECF subfamily)